MERERDGTGRAMPVPAYAAPLVSTPATPRAHHVWVSLSNLTSHEDVLYPGLVIGWRRAREHWEAHVVYVTPEDGGRDTAHVVWLEAFRLRPA